jgi:hypothetical protein
MHLLCNMNISLAEQMHALYFYLGIYINLLILTVMLVNISLNYTYNML